MARCFKHDGKKKQTNQTQPNYLPLWMVKGWRIKLKIRIFV